MNNNNTNNDKEKQIIKELSDRIVDAQRPIRILDAIKWDESIKQKFFKHKCQRLPEINADYYKGFPLAFDADDKKFEFHEIIRHARNQLGQFSSITRLMEKRCEEYAKAVSMLQARGTPKFSHIAQELYGAADDAFYPNGPRLSELGKMLGDTLRSLNIELHTEADEKRYTPEQALDILQAKFKKYFIHHDNVTVKISDNIVADAAAGADCIKLNQDVMFSERDLRYLEVHEGWVHVGTTLNGTSQPYCTFLGKGSPASSMTQEGLAVITEIFTFSSYPKRMLKITNRVESLDRVRQGANFIDIFRYFKEQGLSDDDAYNYSMRAFRGSTPDGGAFTKDLSYAKGFILIYNFIRLAVQQNLIDHIPLFFVGKTLIDDIPVLYDLMNQGMIIKPIYIPPQFSDLSALTSWMSFSLYLNKFDLEAASQYYKQILRQ